MDGKEEVKRLFLYIMVAMVSMAAKAETKGLKTAIHKVDSALAAKYMRTKYDTNYMSRPATKLILTGRLNFSGTRIRSEGLLDNQQRFKTRMDADFKTTVSVGVNYMGIGINLALNPAKLAGKYHDFELNFTKYGNQWGGEVSYQDAKNFSGWIDKEGEGEKDLPTENMQVRTLNVNFYYAFNHRRFSYPAAFTQTYIQRRSAGSFLLAASYQGQWGNAEADGHSLSLRLNNIGIGAGYGYNCVPSEKWLLHISALPTFIVHSNTSAAMDEKDAPLHYHFPEVIITSRGAVIRNFKRSFMGMSLVFNFTNVGDKNSLDIRNVRWLFRAFYGVRL